MELLIVLTLLCLTIIFIFNLIKYKSSNYIIKGMSIFLIILSILSIYISYLNMYKMQFIGIKLEKVKSIDKFELKNKNEVLIIKYDEYKSIVPFSIVENQKRNKTIIEIKKEY